MIAYPKTDYLLTSNTELLHNQSTIWLKDIEFWQDEIAFFYKRLHKIDSKKTVPITKFEELGWYLKINTEKLEKHKNEIRIHENLLASLMRGSSINEEKNYRKTHGRLLKVMYDDQSMVTNFKSNLFCLFSNSK